MKTQILFLIVWMVIIYSGCIGPQPHSTDTIFTYSNDCDGRTAITKDTITSNCLQVNLIGRIKGKCDERLCPVGRMKLLFTLEDPKTATLADLNDPRAVVKVSIISQSGISTFPHKINLTLKQDKK